jgi:hypothetical protein
MVKREFTKKAESRPGFVFRCLKGFVAKRSGSGGKRQKQICPAGVPGSFVM